jgi:hypothetical protein
VYHKEFQLIEHLREHFKHDLQPYVCISEQCRSDLQYFESLREWRHHMNSQHSRNWIDEIHRSALWFCDVEGHPYQDFATEDELRSHLQAAHPGEFDHRQEERVLRRNLVYVSRAPGVCFLCKFDVASDGPADTTAPLAQQITEPPPLPSKKPGKRLRFAGETDPENSDKEDQLFCRSMVTSHDSESAAHADQWWTTQIRLGTHIAGHLKSLAFRSLRYFDEAKDEGSEKVSQRAAADFVEGSEMLSSTRGQGDHYFELDKWDPTDNENDDLHMLETPLDKDTPDPSFVDHLLDNPDLTNFPNPTVEYWSITTLKTLVHDKAVRQELKLGGQRRLLEDSLVSYILEDALRVFTILAVSVDVDSQDRARKLVQMMQLFQGHEISDSIVSAEISTPDNRRTLLDKELLKLLDPTSELFSPQLRSRIEKNQWGFLVPIFSVNKPNYALSSQTVLPFARENVNKGYGAFSAVYKVRVQQGHVLDENEKVSV